MKQTKTSQEDFNNYLKTIRRGRKTEEKKTTKKKKKLENLNMILNAINDVIKFIESYGSMMLEAKKRAAEEAKTGKGLKILILKVI